MRLIMSNNADRAIEFKGHIIKRNHVQRLSFATKRTSKWVGLAFLSIFVPVAHFVLVPSFLIGAIVTFFTTISLTETLITDSLPICDQCHKSIILGSTVLLTRRQDCPQCGQKYIVDLGTP